MDLPFDTGLVSRSPDETARLAAAFYQMVKPDALVALYGPLGAGKTVFVRGLALAAGIHPDEVSSPSFTLINEYLGGKTPIFHLDLYRLKSPVEFYGIGGDEYLTREGIVLIEWAENGGNLIPTDRHNVCFEIIDEQSRRLTFTRSTRC